MSSELSRRHLLRAGLALCAPLAAPSVGACEIMVGGFRILHPWTRATGADATWAVLCMTIDEVTEADRLISVSTPVAEGAEMGGAEAGPKVDWAIPVGRESVLSENGTFVKLVGLKHALQVGRAYPLTLGFELAGPVSASLTVDFGRFR